jgi:hypothetical protein
MSGRRHAKLTVHARRLTPAEICRELHGIGDHEEAAAMCAALGVPMEDWPDIARGIGEVYFILSPKLKAIKIGFSFTTERRRRALQTGSSDRHVLLGTVRGPAKAERDLHRKFAALRISGEWFKATKRLRQYIEVNAK